MRRQPKVTSPTVSQTPARSPRSSKNIKNNQKVKSHKAANKVGKIVGGAAQSHQSCQPTHAGSPESSNNKDSNFDEKTRKLAIKVAVAWARWLTGQDHARPVYARRVPIPLPPLPRHRALVPYPSRVTFLAAPYQIYTKPAAQRSGAVVKWLDGYEGTFPLEVVGYRRVRGHRQDGAHLQRHRGQYAPG
jgi:hypothetical protein